MLIFCSLFTQKLHAQCADIYSVWNGVGVYTITARVDSSCTWEKSMESYVTGDALSFAALTGNTYRFSVCGGAAGADTEINIYRQATGFPNVGYVDDGCGVPNGESVINWTPPANASYYIVVSLKGCINTSVPISLTVRRTRVANDICETATTANSGTNAFNTANSCGYSPVSCEVSNRDVWFAYTPADGGMTSFSTCGASFDTHLSLWTDCNGVELACNDDAVIGPCASTTRSYFEYPVVAGTTYYVRVGGYNNATGSGNLTITPPPPGSEPGEDCSNPFLGSACNQAYLNQTTIGLGNDQSNRTCGSGSYPGEDAYYLFSTSDGLANRLRVTLKNVSDANDGTVEVILMSGTCNAPSCTNEVSFDISSGTFPGGLDYYDFIITPLASAGTYYVVIDSRNDGIDAYDLYLDCYRSNTSPGTACSVDDVNNDGIVTTWNGEAAPPTVGVGQRRSICHEVWVNGNNFRGLNAVRLQVSECLGSISDFSSDGSDNAFYGTGNWVVDSVVGQTVYWNFYGGVSRCAPGEIDVAIDISTDNWGSELYWELVPDGEPCGSSSAIFVGGNTANLDCASGGLGITPPGGYPNNTTISEGFWCVSPGNYDIQYVDSYGDGGATFQVYINQIASSSFTPPLTTSTATFSFSASEQAIPRSADITGAASSYSCNSYTFCYDATVLAEGLPCFYNDSIRDIITLYDNGAPVAGQSNMSSWYTRMNGGDATVLPIDLLSFEARLQEPGVGLYWKTATELETEWFALERLESEDQLWQPIALLRAAGNSSTPVTYFHHDRSAGAGSVYYRLKAIDMDGSYSLHGPVHVRVPATPLKEVHIWPNPATHFAQIRFDSESQRSQHWSLNTLTGTPILQGQFSAGEGQQNPIIDLNGIPGGMYLFDMVGFKPTRLMVE